MNKARAKREARALIVQVVRREIGNGLIYNFEDLNEADKKRLFEAINALLDSIV